MARTPLRRAVTCNDNCRLYAILIDAKQEEFGKLFGVSHSAVVKWEKSKDTLAKIVLTTDREIRMHILDLLLKKAEDFRLAYHVIHRLNFQAEPSPFSINSQTDLVAI
jgi:hypothetical protein